MLRTLLILLIIYLMYRMLTRDRRQKDRKTFTFHFGRFPNEQPSQTNVRKNIEHVEDAEYEDITDKKEEKEDS
jgi:hypothetical protein